MYSACTACGLRFWTGNDLKSVLASARQCFDLCHDYGQHHIALLCKPLLQGCLNLMGHAAGSPLILTGEIMDEKAFLNKARVEHNTGLEFFALQIKYVLATYLGEFIYAETLSAQIRHSVDGNHPPVVPLIWTFHQFYEGLVTAAHANSYQKPSFTRKRALLTASRRLKAIRQAAEHCPENMMNKVHLIEADLCVCYGKFDKAESKYRQSIVFAGHEGFLAEQALACEKLARMLRDHTEKVEQAADYFDRALALYKQYGATILVDRLSREIEIGHRQNTYRDCLDQKWPGRAHFRDGCLIPDLCERDFHFARFWPVESAAI
jgi:tetratricopeptide (TPR) repeat protein